MNFLRQYGLREYLLTLSFALLCGIGVAALINASAGSATGEATLKTKAQLEANSSRLLTTRTYKPVARARPVVRRHRAQPHHRRHARVRHSAPVRSAPAAPRLVAVTTPVATPRPVVRRPAPAPRPVVRTPRPAPRPAPAPKRSSGGSLQFDDSG